MTRISFCAIMACLLIFASCNNDEPAFTEDNLAGTWALVSLEGMDNSVSDFGGTTTTTETQFTLLSSDFQLDFTTDPNEVTGQIGSFTLESTQTTNMGGATVTTQVVTEFTEADATWGINGDVLTFTYPDGQVEVYTILQLNNSTLEIKQELMSEVEFGGGTITTDSESVLLFDRI